MRYCGIDVSGTPNHQQLCTLHERRGSDGRELVATFFEPGDVPAIAHYWRLKTNIDSGLFEAVQHAGIAALSPDTDGDVKEMNALYTRRRDLVVDALRDIGVDVSPPKATIYVWAPIPAGFDSSAAYCEHVLEQVAVVISPGGAYGPNGEGFFRISLTTPDDRLREAVQRLGQLATH